MNILELRKKYYDKIDSFDFDIIISLILKKPREFVLTYPNKKLTNIQVKKIESLIKRRRNNEPLAYLTGRKEFFSNKFIVNKNVLVPRPETEIMVEEALHYIRQNKESKTIIDIGTGSGCIIISLAKELRNKKNISYFGLDISSEALKISKKNAKINKVDKRIKFIKSDLLEIIQNSKFDARVSANTVNAVGMKQCKIQNSVILTANLPYLTAKQIKNSPSIKKEPRLALIAGSDGLKYYKKLFKQIRDIQNKNPEIEFTIFCEIDPSQVNPIKQLTKNTLDKNYITHTKKDLRGLSRFAIIRKKRAVK